MQIKQWEDKHLAHFSYAILSDCELKMVLIDPARNPQPYLDYAAEKKATIAGIIETHPHADFVSSHAELSRQTGAPVYVHSLVGAAYGHTPFDDGHSIEIGKIKLIALHTPGHSPDSISILLEHDGVQKAVFTGDTLFIGDCGRPDLREGAGNLRSARRELAAQMYHTLRNKLMPLNDDVLVYPAHGAGTLCGKGLSKANSSTMGAEKKNNWCLQPMSEAEFVESLLSDQPFVPAYFPYDVELNRKGAPLFAQSVEAVPIGDEVKNEEDAKRLATGVLIVDARNEKTFKAGHLPNSINLMDGLKWETWLGSLVHPGEAFYLAGDNKEQLQALIERAAAIGYEGQIKEAIVLQQATAQQPPMPLNDFRQQPSAYTVVDVRNAGERKENIPFAHSLSIPLPELRQRVGEIPTDKPVVVHCAAGYRSAAGSSIVLAALQGRVPAYDLGEAIKEFEGEPVGRS